MKNVLCVLVVSMFICAVYCKKDDKKNSTDPAVHTFAVNGTSSGPTCIVLKAGIRLMFNYTLDNRNTSLTHVDVPGNSNSSIVKYVNGTCSDKKETITLLLNKNWNVALEFNKTKDEIVLQNVTVKFRMDNSTVFPNATDTNKTFTVYGNKLPMWETPKGQGYRCSKEDTVTFNLTDSPLYQISTYSLQLETFRAKNDSSLSEEYTQCEQDNDIGNIVPIAVGAALGALVLIVLIAYLVGRKRNIRGYESV